MPHLHLCNRAGFRDNAAKSGKPGHNRDIGPKSGTVPAKPGHLATMRYDLKNVRIATSPIERIDSCKCRNWFRVPKNAPLADKSCESMCSACKELRKRLRQASERISQAPTNSKMKHIQPSSHFPLKYLSPNSLKEQRMNTHEKQALRNYEPQDVVLDDSHHDKMCQVVSALESHGCSKLEGVFAEADAH